MSTPSSSRLAHLLRPEAQRLVACTSARRVLRVITCVGALYGLQAASKPDSQSYTRTLRVEIDRTIDHSLVTFHGSIVVETQTAVHGVISMLQGEKVVVVDLADVRAIDEHGLDALQSVFDASIASVYVIGRTLGPATQELSPP